MNLRKSIISLAAAVGLMASIAVPGSLADEIKPVSSTVNEDGEFTYAATGNPISFAGVEVTTAEGAHATQLNRGLNFSDTHSYNPNGFQLQVTATDLSSGSYTISNENLYIRRYTTPGDLCPAAVNPVVGGNTFQTVTLQVPHLGIGQIGSYLDDPVNLVAGTAGRGCGALGIGLAYGLYVPAGTYTGNGTAVYTGSITISNTLAPAPVVP